MEPSEYKILEKVGSINIIKGKENFVADTDFLTGVVVDGATIPELLRELAISIEIMQRLNKKSN